jgi:hypothetical protein
MKKFWWIVSVSVHRFTNDGTPGGDNYPIEMKRVFKTNDSDNQTTYEFFYQKVLSFLKENHMEKGSKLNFVWCLGDEEEITKANELEKYLVEKLKIL